MAIKYSLSYDANNYSGGYTVNININNIGDETIGDWTMEFDFAGDEQILSFWNVASYLQEGSHVTATNESFTGNIPPGGSAQIGMSVSSTNPFIAFNNVTLNGIPPTIEYGDISVTVNTPSFSPSIFTPTITIGDISMEIPWGETKPFTLPADMSYLIEAEPYVTTEYIYSGEATPNSVDLKPDTVVNVVVDYTQNEINPNVFGGYFASWSDRWANQGMSTDLANLPSYVNLVLVSFGKPDMTYSGNLNLDGTGLSFSYDGSVLKEAIAVLKQRNPSTKVVLSIGGETYTGWDEWDIDTIVTVVQDFGFDGIDIDFEPDGGFGCLPDASGVIKCRADQQYIELIQSARAALPRPMIVTASPFSVGAYGEDQWVDAPPANLANTGMFLNPMRTAGDDLDYVNVQGYNAGEVFDPLQATQAYNFYFGNGILMGAHVPPEAYGNHIWTVSEINRVGSYINDNNVGGMMMWQLYATTPDPSDDFPDNQIMASAIARNLGFPNYDAPLFPLSNPSDLSNVDNITIEGMNARVPNNPSISSRIFPSGNNYELIMYINSGYNATMVTLYENGNPIVCKAVTDTTPDRQEVRIKLSSKPDGYYSYRFLVENSFGAVYTDYLTLNILQAY
ncbi:glycosyl hydrolase family 18 protein [Clostridiaceae bacterium M8S5]|nr:glycosyl hydrolase family 18 protein [Clostridiaceae bacterium M8S5]